MTDPNAALTVPTADGGVFCLRLEDSLRLEGIAEALATMTGSTVCDARRELAAAIARLTEGAAYPAPECEMQEAK